MANFNQWTGLGNLTRDPEVRYAAKGTAVTSFCLAINRKWKSESGESKEEVLFMDCTAFGQTAETIAQYTKKGRSLLVSGRMKSNEWEDKQTGQKRSKIGCVVESFQFIGDNRGEEDETDKPSAPSRPAKVAQATKAASAIPVDDDDDVPF